jgi:hypothetical protein
MGVMVGMGVTGVAVKSPMKMGTAMKVAVGWFGSQVGRCTIVGEEVMVGVIVGVDVSTGVKVAGKKAVGGTGVLVGELKILKGMPAQA